MTKTPAAGGDGRASRRSARVRNFMSFTGNRRRVSFFGVVLCVAALPVAAAAQEKSPTPATTTPVAAAGEAQDEVKITVEEVRIPVAAYDGSGRFDPTLRADDLLVREDGVAQQIKGVYRVPAYVMLLLDTGGEANLAKDVRLTREVAVRLASSLRPGDRVAVMQVNNRVELLSDWTADGASVVETLRSKLLPGKRTLLAESVVAAVERFRATPAGNRHLVLISDGLDSPGGPVGLTQAFEKLTEANVTVHVISYTSLGRRAARPSAARMREGSSLPDEAVASLPHTRVPGNQTPDLRDMNEAKGGVTLDIERLIRRDKKTKAELERREREFARLADETGGLLWLPASAAEMLRQAGEVAREVDSQYVVTYRPLRPLSEAKAGERRSVDVIPRRVNLRVRARRGYVAKAAG